MYIIIECVAGTIIDHVHTPWQQHAFTMQKLHVYIASNGITLEVLVMCLLLALLGW